MRSHPIWILYENYSIIFVSGDQFIWLTMNKRKTERERKTVNECRKREDEIKCEPIRVQKYPNKAARCLTLNAIWNVVRQQEISERIVPRVNRERKKADEMARRMTLCDAWKNGDNNKRIDTAVWKKRSYLQRKRRQNLFVHSKRQRWIEKMWTLALNTWDWKRKRWASIIVFIENEMGSMTWHKKKSIGK